MGTNHFLLLETALSLLGQEQHEETPEPRWPQASTWLMPGWGLKAIQPHACRPRPQQALPMQRGCLQGQHRLMQSQPRLLCTHGPLTPVTRQALSCIICMTQQFMNYDLCLKDMAMDKPTIFKCSVGLQTIIDEPFVKKVNWCLLGKKSRLPKAPH